MHEQSVRSALENVLRNAARHTVPGSQVAVSLHATAAGGARVVIEDQGPGSSPGQLPHAFQPFYRASSTEGDAGGSGIRP